MASRMNSYQLHFEDLSKINVISYNSGSYGEVFLDSINNVVYKLFKRKKNDKYESYISHKTFESETFAYDRIKILK